jgi:hypothetical protein
MIVFGGRDASGFNLNDVRVLTNASGAGSHPAEWIKLIPNGAAGSPPARSGHSAVYDSVNNRLIVFGGCADYVAPVLNDVWVLSNANGLGGTPVWTQLSPTGAPPPGRTNAVAAYGSISTFPPLTQNALLIVSGQDGSADPCSTISDMWALSNANGLDQTAPAWSNLTEPNLIGVNGAAAAFVPASVLYLFGGMANINGVCSITNDLVEIFTPVRGPGPPGFEVFIQQATNWPAPRAFASATYDSKGGRILVFGGVDASGNYLNDLWSWSTLAPVWSMHSPVGAPPAAREGQAAVFDSASQRMTIFGGSGAGGALNDTWVLRAPFVPGMACTAFGGVPNVARTEGLAEQVADLVLNCIGGTPTPEGHPIPEYYISLALNTDETTRLLPEAKGLSEALLFIDEQYPAVPSPPPPLSPPPQPHSPPQMLCTPLGSECPETGAGGTPNPYQTQPTYLPERSAAKTQWCGRSPSIRRARTSRA